MAQAVGKHGEPARSRKRRSREAGMALVEEWRSSGQTPAQFCRVRGIGTHGLQYWRRKLEPEVTPKASVAGEFFALSVPARAQEPELQRGAELVIEIGARDPILVHVPLAAGSAAFVQALRGVLAALAS